MAEPQIPGSSGSTGRHSFGERVLGALKLDAEIYEEVENDPDAMGQAAGVVALGAVAQALVGALAMGTGGLFGGLISAFLGWLLSAGIVWGIGVKLMKHDSDYPQLLRATGFASAPKLLLVFAMIPLLGGLVWLAVGIMLVIAYVIAVRQALDTTTGRAVLICLLAVAVSMLLGLIFGGLSAA